MYAYIDVLDGVSTIGRGVARRTPAAVASWDQMTGSLEALADGDPATAPGAVEHDAAAVAVSSLALVPVVSGWALNPATGSPRTQADLPAEIGVRSA